MQFNLRYYGLWAHKTCWVGSLIPSTQSFGISEQSHKLYVLFVCVYFRSVVCDPEGLNITNADAIFSSCGPEHIRCVPYAQFPKSVQDDSLKTIFIFVNMIQKRGAQQEMDKCKIWLCKATPIIHAALTQSRTVAGLYYFDSYPVRSSLSYRYCITSPQLV